MGPFRCSTCGTGSAQAAECRACGGRTFVLTREAQRAAAVLLGRDEPRGELVSISEAPSFRARRRRGATDEAP